MTVLLLSGVEENIFAIKLRKCVYSFKSKSESALPTCLGLSSYFFWEAKEVPKR